MLMTRACFGHGKKQGGGSFLVFFLFFFWYFFFGLGAPGGKKARQEATARKDRKEGRKEGGREERKEVRREGRKEGRKEGGRARKGPYFCSHLRWKHWQQRYFLLNPEPKPYGPKALNHLTP